MRSSKCDLHTSELIICWNFKLLLLEEDTKKVSS